ncbi:MAG: hypothetical protein JXN61_04625 [Sedimentisphaerales bacterium]|nr:hypothetical protein [Sedimentisphaerales bacterium]
MRQIAAIVITSVVCVGCASTSPSSQATGPTEDSSWQAIRQTDSIEGYLTYLKANPRGPYATESKRRMQTLASQRLANVHQISLTLEPGSKDSGSIDLIAIRQAVEDALKQGGYDTSQTASADAKLVVSTSREGAIQGTSASYWHPFAITRVRIAFEFPDCGRLFTKRYYIESAADMKTVFKFSDINVKPIDASKPTFISLTHGGAWGAGVEFTAPNSGQGVVTSEKALSEYNWDQLSTTESVLSELRRELEIDSPMKLSDKTEWER